MLLPFICGISAAVIAVQLPGQAGLGSPQGPPPFRFAEQACAGLGLQPSARVHPGGPLPSQTIQTTRHSAGAGPCSAAAYAALDPNDLPAALATSADNCLGSLWAFDADVATVIAPANVAAVAALISSDTADVTANAARLRQLAVYYQIAFFHEFYEAAVSYDVPTQDAARQAMVDIATAPPFVTDTPAIEDLRQQWSISVDSTNATHLATATIQAMLERYAADPAHAGDYQERITVYYCLFSLSRQIGNAQIALGDQSPWYTLLDVGFADAVGAVALDTAYTTASEYVVLNAIFALGNFSYLQPATYDLGHDRVSQAYASHVQYSGPWLRAIVDLDNFYDGTLFNGTILDLDQLRDDVMAIALPNTFIHDGGRLIFRTAISAADAAELVDAIREVDSQFFRKSTYLSPVPGDVNEVLTLVIYGSPADYGQYQPFLFGLPTNNGGIFIEGDSHLYTYDRTPAESIYTLEELLRHEYTHYIDSRYLITGSFGQAGTLYDNNRMVWHNEGLAEFMVGATRKQDVLPRRILIDQIDGDASAMPISEIVYATYGSFTFYRYAGTFYAFMNSERPDVMVDLLDLIRANDIVGVDALYAALAADATLQSEFDAYLLARIAEVQGGTGLFAEDVPTTPTPAVLADNNATAVRATLQTELARGDTTFQVSATRYTYTGTLSQPAPQPEPEVVRAGFEDVLDTDLATLEPLGTNFESTVAWFGDVVVADGTATVTVVFSGPYSATAADMSAPTAPIGLTASHGIGVVELSWDDNTEADLNGYHIYRAEASGGPYVQVNAVTVSDSAFDDATVDPGVDYYYVVTALDASGNESSYSVELQAVSPINILLINGYFDDLNHGYINAYANRLAALGYSHRLWNPFVDGPVTAELLGGYVDGLVIWAVGYMQGSSPDQFDVTRQAAIQSYLDGGGNFVISGAYKAVAYDDTVLFQNYFHLEFVQFNVDLGTLVGVPGSPIADGLQMAMSSNVYESEVDPTMPAMPAFTYDPSSGPGSVDSSATAIATIDDGYKVAYIAFPFADIESTDAEVLLDRILAWMLPAEPTCTTAESCADQSGDAIRDDGCVWSDCVTEACVMQDIVFADMGGSFGECVPDGFANVHDRNHALACFAGSNACASINIDAGGAFGACPPDGFCNIHDANAALAAFAGTSTCSCPSGPMPHVSAATVGRATITLRPAKHNVSPGESVDIRAFVRGDIEALRSYQLTVAASGGRSGACALTDIHIESRCDSALGSERSRFDAINIGTGQMLAGLNEDLGGGAESAAYLATFRFDLSRDARGTFVIDLPKGESNQTVLVAAANGRIVLDVVEPAVVNVSRHNGRDVQPKR
jgi:hypothetical protein